MDEVLKKNIGHAAVVDVLKKSWFQCDVKMISRLHGQVTWGISGIFGFKFCDNIPFLETVVGYQGLLSGSPVFDD